MAKPWVKYKFTSNTTFFPANKLSTTTNRR